MSRGPRPLRGTDDLSAAQRLVDEMGGPKAFIHASDRAAQAQNAGDLEQARAWLRIKSALDAILFGKPPSGERTH